MNFQIINITSAQHVRIKVSTATTVVIPTNETVTLRDDQVGFLLPKKWHTTRGMFLQGGIINPGWNGKIEACFIVLEDFHVLPGEKIAHVFILSGRKEY